MISKYSDDPRNAPQSTDELKPLQDETIRLIDSIIKKPRKQKGRDDIPDEGLLERIHTCAIIFGESTTGELKKHWNEIERALHALRLTLPDLKRAAMTRDQKKLPDPNEAGINEDGTRQEISLLSGMVRTLNESYTAISDRLGYLEKKEISALLSLLNDLSKIDDLTQELHQGLKSEAAGIIGF